MSPSGIAGTRTAWWLRGCARVGTAPRLRGRPSINVYGGTITIGDRCSLSSRPVVSHFVAGPSAVLEIGDEVSIAHGAAIAAFERIEIGAGTRIGPFAIIMDTNFHGSSGAQAVHHDCRPVIIGKDCRIGTRVTITRGVSIGDGAEILAGSVVSSAIPAGACAAGARARVIGRAGDAGTRWDGAAAIVPLLIMETLDLDAPPDLEREVRAIPGWRDESTRELLAAIEYQFGVRCGTITSNAETRVTDIAAAVDHLRAASRRQASK